MTKVILKDFSGQINTDIYTPSTVDFRYSENFDLSARQDALMPFRGMTSMTASGFYLSDFIYGNFGTGISENVLAYGVQSGETINGKPELYKISNTLPGTAWATALTTTGTSADSRYQSGTIFNNLFHFHRGFVYLASGTAYVEKIGNLESSGQGATWTTRWKNISFTSVTHGITHSKDGLMYFVYNNGTTSSATSTVVRVTDDSAFLDSAFALPVGWTCTSLCEYGDYIAFALKPTGKMGASKVAIWNRDTSTTTLTEAIDWGEGELNVLDNIDGHLIGISVVYNASFNLSPRIVVKEYSGGTVNIVDTIYISTAFAPVLSTKKWRQNNELYFGLRASLNGTRHAMFRVGKNKSGRFVVTGDVNINNNVSISTLEGFAKIGDIWYIGYDAGSVNRSLTSGASAYGEFNTLTNPNMPISDRPSKKQLKSVQLDYDAIESGESVILQFGVDGGAFKETINDSTVGSTSSTMTIYSDGSEFTSGTDFEFNIRSTGVNVKSLTYVYEVLDSNIEIQ